MTEQPPPQRSPHLPNFGMLPYGETPSPPEPEPDPDADRRPTSVTVGCWLTWVFSGIALVIGLWALLAVNVDRAGFERRAARNNDLDSLGLTAKELAQILTIGGAVAVVLSVLAIWLAVRVHRKRSKAARISLALLSVVTAAISLLLFFAIVPFAWLVVSLTVMALMLSGSAKRWTSPW